MAIFSKTYQTIPSNNLIVSAQFSGSTILGVKRSGTGVKEVYTTPGNQEFLHSASTILFDPTNPFNTGETVWVMWRT